MFATAVTFGEAGAWVGKVFCRVYVVIVFSGLIKGKVENCMG